MPNSDVFQSVVITGASSGIGKATALAFARQGARLTLAARREAELEDTARLCRELGVPAKTVITDVGDQAAVEALAEEAVQSFGRIEVWFNNAGVDAFGTFEDTPEDIFESVMRTNFLGTVHGARACLPHFRRQAAGVLINNASIVGVCPSPLHTSYVASKFAIRGFSHALRQELAAEAGIHVCVVLPSSIDTPLWQRSANYTGRRIKPLDPVHPVEQVADTVLALARTPQREVFAGATGWMLARQHAADPETTEQLVGMVAPASLLQAEPASPTGGAVLEPTPGDGGASGGWMRPESPAFSGADLVAVLGGPALLALPGLYAANLWRNMFRAYFPQIATSVSHQLSPGAPDHAADRQRPSLPLQ